MRLPARFASLACVIAVLAPAAAQAKAPPKGKYDCTIGEGTLFGVLAIKKGGKYSHRGSKGTFKHKGRKLSFKGGTLNKMKGRWYKANDGTPKGTYEIALKNPGSGFESIYCGKRK